MLERYFPDMIEERVQNIDLSLLKKKGIKALLLDIDNTLVPQFTKESNDDVLAWIDKIHSMGLSCCILSNASEERVIKFNEKLKILAIHRAYKPSPKAYLRAAEYMRVKPQEIAAVGDQLFTDIYGGNKLNMVTILVKPIDKNEILFVKLKRHLEKLILSKYEALKSDKKIIEKRDIWKRNSAQKYIKQEWSL